MFLRPPPGPARVFDLAADHSIHAVVLDDSSLLPRLHDMVQHLPLLQRGAVLLPQASVSLRASCLPIVDRSCDPRPGPVRRPASRVLVLGLAGPRASRPGLRFHGLGVHETKSA